MTETSLFEVKAGVRQGCIMSTVLFNLVVDWIMRRITEDKVKGIRWSPFSYLEELDYADDLGLDATTHKSKRRTSDSISSQRKWTSTSAIKRPEL